jgi:hypothetical protein
MKLRQIWKTPLPIADSVKVNIPAGGEILCFKHQKDQLVMWVSFEVGVELQEARMIHCIKTGKSFEPNPYWKYKDTVLMDDDSFVIHIFEERI